MISVAAFLEKQWAEKQWPVRVLLCLAVLVSYASVWPNGFVFDDAHLIAGNEFLKHWSDLPKLLTSLNAAGGGFTNGFYRPVPMLAYFLVYQAFGASTIAFHALNIALHMLNACLLHCFGIRAGFKKGVAFAAALLWVVHPLHTSDVAYMSSTQELLWSLFCLLGLIILLPDFTPRKVALATALFILALGCKETAVVFPALAAMTIFFYNNDRSAYLRIWPLWLLAAGYIAVWLVFVHHGYIMDNTTPSAYSSDFINRVLTSLATLPVYAGLIIWPAGLHIERVFPVFTTLTWQPILGALMAGSCLLLILRARRNLAISFGLLWFAAALSPVTGIVIPIDALISEGWLYMPTMGLFLGVVGTASRFFETRQNAARLLVLVLAVSLGAATFVQNKAWRNPETLYQNIMKNGGRVDRIADHLALFYMGQGEFDEAIKQSQYALDHPDGRPQSLWADTHLLMAMAWLEVHVDKNGGFTMDGIARALPLCQHIPEAIGELEKALQDNPDYYQANVVLYVIYHYQGNGQMADVYRQKVESLTRKMGGSGR